MNETPKTNKEKADESTEEMKKKYTAQVSYGGTINVEVEASSKEEAEEAEDVCEDMDSEEFLEKLEPQHLCTDVQEI